MHKIYLFVSSTALAFVLAACGGGSSDEATDSSAGGTGGPVAVGQNGAVDVSSAGAFAQQVLSATNAARSAARNCGATAMAAVPPLTWNSLITAAASNHSEDMLNRNYFSHTSPEGAGVSERLVAVGYKFTYANENLGSGTTNLNEIMGAWIRSPGHCMAIMAPDAKELGAHLASNKNGSYWTLVFGAP